MAASMEQAVSFGAEAHSLISSMLPRVSLSSREISHDRNAPRGFLSYAVADLFHGRSVLGVQPYCISLMLLESFRDHHTFHVGDESDANTSNTILHDASVLGCSSALTTQSSQLVSNVMRVSK